MATNQPVLGPGVKRIDGRVGPAFSFDGTGRLQVPNAEAFNFRANEDLSIAAWIRPQSAETPFGVMSIIEKRKTGNITSAVGYCLYLENGKLACQLAPFVRTPLRLSDFTSLSRLQSAWARRTQVTPMQFARFTAPGPDLRDGGWHHVALTLERRSPTGGKLYVDGRVVLAFDPTHQAGTLVNAEPLLIGTHPDKSLRCGFRGDIEDARLYRRALSLAEVRALSNP